MTVTANNGYTLDQLTARVAEEIGRLGTTQSNGQVATVPDGRTLRYYASLGLLDKPQEVRGRRAIYGERHVRQAVAVKALQAEGLSLGEIQLRLTGRSDAELSRILRRPDATRFWRRPPAPPTDPDPDPDRDRDRDRDRDDSDHHPDHDRGRDGSGRHRGEIDEPQPAAIRLAPGVVLVVEGDRAPTAGDATALRRSAAELLAELRRRNLLDTNHLEEP